MQSCSQLDGGLRFLEQYLNGGTLSDSALRRANKSLQSKLELLVGVGATTGREEIEAALKILQVIQTSDQEAWTLICDLLDPWNKDKLSIRDSDFPGGERGRLAALRYIYFLNELVQKSNPGKAQTYLDECQRFLEKLPGSAHSHFMVILHHGRCRLPQHSMSKNSLETAKKNIQDMMNEEDTEEKNILAVDLVQINEWISEEVAREEWQRILSCVEQGNLRQAVEVFNTMSPDRLATDSETVALLHQKACEENMKCGNLQAAQQDLKKSVDMRARLLKACDLTDMSALMAVIEEVAQKCPGFHVDIMPISGKFVHQKKLPIGPYALAGLLIKVPCMSILKGSPSNEDPEKILANHLSKCTTLKFMSEADPCAWKEREVASELQAVLDKMLAGSQPSRQPMGMTQRQQRAKAMADAKQRDRTTQVQEPQGQKDRASVQSLEVAPFCDDLRKEVNRSSKKAKKLREKLVQVASQAKRTVGGVKDDHINNAMCIAMDYFNKDDPVMRFEITSLSKSDQKSLKDKMSFLLLYCL